MSESSQSDGFTVTKAVDRILSDARRRGSAAFTRARYVLGAQLLSRVPQTQAGYVNLEGTDQPDYNQFELAPSEEPTVLADIVNFMSTSLQYDVWANRGTLIRNAGSRAYCTGNLSVALDGMGAAYAAGSQGAGTLLTLIPTANVLIGAPAKELWVLYKLCPLAGILSILLSLGGSIIPMEVNDYENITAFHYQNFMPLNKEEQNKEEEEQEARTPEEQFAWLVQRRAKFNNTAQPKARIYAGMVMQCAWIAAILVACWFLSAGAVVVWLCDVGEWMYIWYVTVALASIIENFAGVPFTRTTTIRVWRAPKVMVDPETPWAIKPPAGSESEQLPSTPGTFHTPYRTEIPRKPVLGEHVEGIASGSNSQMGYRTEPNEHDRFASKLFSDPAEILKAIDKGYNTFSNVYINPAAPFSQSSDPFYVLISIQGVTNSHAILRVVSKCFSIGVFAVGTSLFASTTLITIIVAMITAILILAASIFGRVTAMYMAHEMLQCKPVLHKVVKGPAEAGRYLQALFEQPDLAFEVNGHIITQGRVIKKFPLFHRIRSSHFLGVLARPFDLRKMATNGLELMKGTEQTYHQQMYSPRQEDIRLMGTEQTHWQSVHH